MFTLRRPPHQDEGMLIMSLCKLLHYNSMGPRGIELNVLEVIYGVIIH